MKSNNLCNLCKGAGSLICFPDGSPEWWPCTACYDSGAKIMYAPSMFSRKRIKDASNR